MLFCFILFLLYRRKKKCIRFIIGADGETTEIIVKEQDPSDSDDNENRIPPSDLESKEGLKELVNNNEILKLSSNNNNNSETSTTTLSDIETSTTTNTTKNDTTYSSSAVIESVITCAASSASGNSPSSGNSRVTYTSNGHTLTDLRTDSKPVDFSRL